MQEGQRRIKLTLKSSSLTKTGTRPGEIGHQGPGIVGAKRSVFTLVHFGMPLGYLCEGIIRISGKWIGGFRQMPAGNVDLKVICVLMNGERRG